MRGYLLFCSYDNGISFVIGKVSKQRNTFYYNAGTCDDNIRWVKLYRNCWFFDKKPMIPPRIKQHILIACDIELGPFEQELKNSFDFWVSYCKQNNFDMGGILTGIGKIDLASRYKEELSKNITKVDGNE